MQNGLVKLISSIVALGLAIIFTYIAPGSQVEAVILLVLSSIGTWLGIDWRRQYDEIKTWLASKTIVGALLVGIPSIIVAAVTLGVFSLPAEIVEILTYIASGGGLLFLTGITHAVVRK